MPSPTIATTSPALLRRAQRPRACPRAAGRRARSAMPSRGADAARPAPASSPDSSAHVHAVALAALRTRCAASSRSRSSKQKRASGAAVAAEPDAARRRPAPARADPGGAHRAARRRRRPSRRLRCRGRASPRCAARPTPPPSRPPAASAAASGCVDQAASDAGAASRSAASPQSARQPLEPRAAPAARSVSVPVLSMNSVCMRARPSIASSRRSSTPRRAIAPAAASSADGAASDSAHGQVTISTETATPERPRRVDDAPRRGRRRGEQQHAPQERRGPAVGCAAAARGRCVVRVAHQRDDRPRSGCRRRRRSTRISTGAPRLTLPATRASPGALADRPRLAAQQRLVGLRSRRRAIRRRPRRPRRPAPAADRRRAAGRTLTVSTAPSARRRSTACGRRRTESSSAVSARWRARISR